MYDGEAREVSMTFYRIDGTIGDEFTLQEAPISSESKGAILGVPGFGSMLPILAIFGAALRRLR